jgi:phosphoribosyl-ATP pyrophosphohydrolase
MDVFEQLTDVLEARRAADPKSSYVAHLYAMGLDHIPKKVAEEAAEAVIAAKNVETPARNDALIGEVADLWFHTMVMLITSASDLSRCWTNSKTAGVSRRKTQNYIAERMRSRV